MINYRTIYKIIGSLLFIEAALMLSCLAMAIYYVEDDIMAFLVSIIATLFFGFVFRFMGRNSDNTMGRRDACLVVSLSWAIFSAIGTMPFMIGGYLHSFTDAYFETMSGFTTTGATIIDDVEALPHGIIFWRSLTQWIGGLGIVFFTIALLPSLVGGSVKVFSAEATGPIKSKLHPKLSTSAKAIWAVYLTISIACTLCYKFLGMGWFDSVNYSMTSLATGGFSTHNSSVEFFHSPAIEYAVTFFCFISRLLRELGVVNLLIDPVVPEKLLMCAAADQLPVIEHQNPVRILHRSRALRHNEAGDVLRAFADCRAERGIGCEIERRGTVV